MDNRVTGMRFSPGMAKNAYPDGFYLIFSKKIISEKNTSKENVDIYVHQRYV